MYPLELRQCGLCPKARLELRIEGPLGVLLICCQWSNLGTLKCQISHSVNNHLTVIAATNIFEHFFYIRHYAKHFTCILFFFFLVVLGLRFCARVFSSCGKWGPRFIAVRGPLTIAASLVAEHGLQTRRLSSCGSRA